jgi:hypothetical protein
MVSQHTAMESGIRARLWSVLDKRRKISGRNRGVVVIRSSDELSSVFQIEMLRCVLNVRPERLFIVNSALSKACSFDPRFHHGPRIAFLVTVPPLDSERGDAE